jgi:hypothetical protein
VTTYRIFRLLSAGWLWSQSSDQPPNLSKQFPRHGNFRHLEHDVPDVRAGSGANFDELPPEG